MQIENYNKKIEGLKGEVAKTAKSTQLIKKDIKLAESVRVPPCRPWLLPHPKRTRCSSN
jgi:hypothetical protein